MALQKISQDYPANTGFSLYDYESASLPLSLILKMLDLAKDTVTRKDTEDMEMAILSDSSESRITVFNNPPQKGILGEILAFDTEKDAGIAGGIYALYDSRSLHIEKLYVMPQLRGNKIGKSLIDAIMAVTRPENTDIEISPEDNDTIIGEKENTTDVNYPDLRLKP